MMVTTGTDRRRQMTMPTTAGHSQVATSRGTEHLLHESATSHNIDQISSSHQCRSVVCLQNHQCAKRVKRIGRYLAGKPIAKCWFRWQQRGELEAYSHTDWGGDKAIRRSVSARVIMRGGHCLKVWTKKQQVVSLSSAESELYAAVKTASEGLGVQSVAKELGILCWLDRDGVLIGGTETGTARLLRLPDIPSGHIVVSSFVCALSDLRLICVTASLAQVKQLSEFHPSSLQFTSRHVTSLDWTERNMT